MPLYTPGSDVALKMRGTAGGALNNNFIEFSGLYTPTIAMGFAIDISAAGFSGISSIVITPIRATTDPMQVVNAAVQSYTNTSLVINLTQGNSATVAIVGINVLSGGPVVAATLTNLQVMVRIEGF